MILGREHDVELRLDVALARMMHIDSAGDIECPAGTDIHHEVAHRRGRRRGA